MQGNMIAVCRVNFAEGSQELSSCLNTAETMFTAVYTFQESLGGQLDSSYKCPGQVRAVSAEGFFMLNSPGWLGSDTDNFKTDLAR
jgi:hypothetical protein